MECKSQKQEERVHIADEMVVGNGSNEESGPMKFNGEEDGYELKEDELPPVDEVPMKSSYRQSSEVEKAQVNSLKEHGVCTCNILGLMLRQEGCQEGFGFFKKDMYNHINKNNLVRVGNGEAVAASSYVDEDVDEGEDGGQ